MRVPYDTIIVINTNIQIPQDNMSTIVLIKARYFKLLKYILNCSNK